MMKIYRYLVTVLLTVTAYSIGYSHPSNTKRVGVCVYYKAPLPLKLLDIKYLQECINLALIIGDNLCSFIIPYRSPSQTRDDFETFMKNIELNLDEINKKILSYLSLLVILMLRTKLGLKMAKHCTNPSPPRWNSPCRGEGAYPLRSSNQCINKWSSSERCGYVR